MQRKHHRPCCRASHANICRANDRDGDEIDVFEIVEHNGISAPHIGSIVCLSDVTSKAVQVLRLALCNNENPLVQNPILTSPEASFPG